LFMKFAKQEIFKELKEQKGQVRNMEIMGYVEQMAGPGQTPQTNRRLLLKSLGGLDQQDAYSNDYFKWREGAGRTAVTQGAFQNDWLNQKEHDPKLYQNKRDYDFSHRAGTTRPGNVPKSADMYENPTTFEIYWEDPVTHKRWDNDGNKIGR